jgi:hypothetical protein
MPEPVFKKLDMHITVLEPTSMAFSINPSHQSVVYFNVSPFPPFAELLIANKLGLSNKKKF